MRRAFPLAVIVAVMSFLSGLVLFGSGAGAQSLEANPSVRGLAVRAALPDLSSREAIEAYLLSIGVDPATAVYQTGARNYAGPDCPGVGWNCTQLTGSAVVQMSSDDDDDGDDGDDGDGENVFECSPAGTGTDPATNTCVVVQTNTSGTNRAVCREADEQAEGTVEQSCTITQTNVSGRNEAVVDQSIDMAAEGTAQRGEQRASVTQTNGTGSNLAFISQRASLSADVGGDGDDGDDDDDNGGGGGALTVEQIQDVIQDLVLDQETNAPTGAGNNAASVLQSHSLDAEVNGAASSEQLQNATAPTGETNAGCQETPNVCAVVDQHSTDGDQVLTLRQNLSHDADAEDVSGNVDQQQGSSPTTGGMEVVLEQVSPLGDFARRFVSQRERQAVDEEGTGGLVTQEQYTGIGPRKFGTQVCDGDCKTFVDQNVVQMASDPTIQDLTERATCSSPNGACTVHQFGRQQDETEEQTVGPAAFVDATLQCTGFGEGEITIAQVNECGSSGTTTPPTTTTSTTIIG